MKTVKIEVTRPEGQEPVVREFKFDDQNAASPTRTLIHTLIQHITSVFTENANAEIDIQSIQVTVDHTDEAPKVVAQMANKAGPEMVEADKIGELRAHDTGLVQKDTVASGATVNKQDEGVSGTGFQASPAPGDDGSEPHPDKQDTTKPAPASDAAAKQEAEKSNPAAISGKTPPASSLDNLLKK